MSLNKYTVLLLGVQVESNKELLDKHWDVLELDLDSGIKFLYGEGSEFCYIGKVLAISEPYSLDDNNSQIDYDPENVWLIDGIVRKINQYYCAVETKDMKLWFFDYWR